MDSLKRFRNVERWIYQDECIDSDPNGPLIDYADFTALLAVAEEQQKEIERLTGIVKTGTFYPPYAEMKQRAEAAEAKLSAMEEVVKAGTFCAETQISYKGGNQWECLYCHCESFTAANEIPHKIKCPVGIVLSFTKNRSEDK